MFYIYLLKSKKDDSLYIGFAVNLKERLLKHNQNMVFSTKNITPMDLIYFEGYRSKKDALIREKRLKQFAQVFYSLKRRIPNSLSML